MNKKTIALTAEQYKTIIAIGRFAVASANGYLIEKTAILSLLLLCRSH